MPATGAFGRDRTFHWHDAPVARRTTITLQVIERRRSITEPQLMPTLDMYGFDRHITLLPVNDSAGLPQREMIAHGFDVARWGAGSNRSQARRPRGDCAITKVTPLCPIFSTCYKPASPKFSADKAVKVYEPAEQPRPDE